MQRATIVESVEISTIAHATDDLSKVQTAIRSILPDPLRDRDVFTRRYLQGHHGNPIVTFEAKLKRRMEVDQFVQHFLGRIPRSDRLLIERDLGLHSDDDGNLYIRVDKQQAYQGKIEFGEEDPIRIKMKFTRLGGDARDLMRKALESE